MKDVVGGEEFSLAFQPKAAMSNPYRYPEVGHVYRYCVMCGRPFRVVRSRLLRHGKFCTRECFRRAWKLFSEALADKRLGPILGGAPQKANGALAEPGGGRVANTTVSRREE
jgi:hypothetical protein